MSPSRAKAWIIAAALCVMAAGCASVKFAYGNGAQLAWWWVDGYVDFSSDQAPHARQAVDRFFDWHRRTQLPAYVALLRQAQAQVMDPTTPQAVCRWQADVRAALEPSLQQALQLFSEQMPGLGERQLRALEKKYAKNDADLRRDFLQPDSEERFDASFKRALERGERLYGRLDEPQRRVLREGLAASPFNAEMLMAERQRRQRDVVQSLRRLVAERAGPEARIGTLRALVERAERSPDADYRAYQERLVEYDCALWARVHNATTPAQRVKARETLSGWEGDLRSFLSGV